jgi:hypothetical protein
MNFGSEHELRSQLGAALDLLDPGPLPLDEVVTHGKTVIIRRRALAALAVVVLAAAAVTVPELAERLAHPAPAAPPRYHVTVNPPGKGADRHLVAFGRLGKMSWRVKVTLSGGQFNTCFNFDNRGFDCNSVSNTPNFPTNPVALALGEGQGPAILTMTVRNDVRYLLVSLSNGQIVTLRPVAAIGRSHPAFVAIMVPSFAAITDISAYSENAELGYTVPFTAPTDIETLLWLKPGQPALPKPVQYVIGSGRARGHPWTERLYVGPWGFCLSNSWDALEPGGNAFQANYDCSPVSVDRPVVKPAQIWVQDYSQSQASFAVIIGSRRFSYVVARTGPGSSFLVKVHRVGAASFAVLVGLSRSTHWIAYSAAGQVLGSNSFN